MWSRIEEAQKIQSLIISTQIKLANQQLKAEVVEQKQENENNQFLDGMVEIEWEKKKIRIHPHEKIVEIRQKIENMTERCLSETGMRKIARMLKIQYSPAEENKVLQEKVQLPNLQRQESQIQTIRKEKREHQERSYCENRNKQNLVSGKDKKSEYMEIHRRRKKLSNQK